MKNLHLTLFFALLTSPLAYADPVAVQGGVIFIADRDQLSVEALDPTLRPLPSACQAQFPIAIPGARDVVISNGRAVVTAGLPGNLSVHSVDVTACIGPNREVCDAQPSLDLNRGNLHLPCLEVDGHVYHVTMTRRGSSMNWEVTGLVPNPGTSTNKTK